MREGRAARKQEEGNDPKAESGISAGRNPEPWSNHPNGVGSGTRFRPAEDRDP